MGSSYGETALNETEIERLVVRMFGDVSDFKGGMADAEGAAKDAADAVEKHSERIEGFVGKLKEYGKGALEFLESLGIAEVLHHASEEWEQSELATVRLSAALKAQGRDVESLMGKYEAFASELQKTTVLSDETVMGMLKQAEAMGVSGSKAQRAVKNAIALAATMGESGSAPGYIRQTVGLEQGRVGRLEMMLPALRAIKDDSEKAAAAQELLGKNFSIASAEAETGAGKAKVAANAYSDMLEGVGKEVMKVLEPFRELKRDVVEMFSGLSEETKQAIVTIALLTAGVLALQAAIVAAGFVFNTMFGGVGIVFGLIVTAAAATAVWAKQAGGLAEVWKQVKDSALEAWAWLKPIRIALSMFFTSAMQIARDFWSDLKMVALDAWESVLKALGLDDAKVSWEELKETVTEVILTMQFAMENFSKMAKLGWVQFKLDALGVFEDIKYFFTDELPTFAENWYNFWQAMGKNAGDMMETVFRNMSKNVINLLANMGSIMRGEKTFDQLWTPMLEGFKKTTVELKSTGKRTATDLEKELTELRNSLGMELGKDYKEFMEEKLKELQDHMKEVAGAEKGKDDGEDYGKEWTKAAGGEMQKLEAALVQSAEAASRVAEYRDRLMHPEDYKGGKGGAGNMDAKQAFGADAAVAREKELALLDLVAKNTGKMADKKSVEVEEADLA